MKQGQRGFTLIELLVVIAIIAILAAILFPVFAQARAKARGASCLSNIKQLTLGMTMYAQDYDESFPQWHWDESYNGGSSAYTNNATSLWWNAIYPYVKNAAVYHCPDDNYNFTIRQDGAAGWFTSGANITKVVGLNPALYDTIISYGSQEPLTYDHPKLAQLSRPADTLIVSDMITTLTGWECWDCYDASKPNKPENNYRLRRAAYPNGSAKSYFWTDPAWMGPFQKAWDADGRHSYGNNVGFADGHAKYRPVSRMTVDLFGAN
ncbi:MAG: prepilin-type N-terminal cleavage/methylation domain [Chthonomonadaceae bacterium]|nr:prepilin-type N-terminal cleavage/methylation domain [Chthonomonadaceae bacterium]